MVAFAVLSAITYGSADFLGGIASKRHRAIAVVAVSQMVGFVLLLVLLPFLGPDRYRLADFAWGAAAGVVGGAGLIFFYRGLSTGRMAVVAPLSAVMTALVPLAFGLLIGERPSTLAGVGVVAAIPAIALITRERADEHGENRSTGALDGFIAGIGFGAFFVLISRTDPNSGLWPLVGARTASIPFTLLLAAGFRQPIKPFRELDTTVAWAGVLDIAANGLYLFAVRSGLISLASVVTSLYPASTIILARVVLKEQMTAARLLGIVLALVGIALIATG
ncbi:MAG: DMT family transporter [Acidimicrobiia bacterium]